MKLAVAALVLFTSATAHAEWDRLLGVDADGKHAIVVHDDDPWHADTYDVATGTVVASWKATGDNAKLRPSGGPAPAATSTRTTTASCSPAPTARTAA
jgi:hypothetical protein